MSDSDRSLCAATASLLQAGRALGGWSLVITAVSILVIAMSLHSPSTAANALFAVVALLGIGERYLAARVAFDASLFDALARSAIASIHAMDSALLQLGVVRVAPPDRPLADRVAGARRLALRHGAVVVSQTILLAAALAWR